MAGTVPAAAGLRRAQGAEVKPLHRKRNRSSRSAGPLVFVRAVLDTKLYVSAFALPGSIAEEALQEAAFKRYDLLTSPAILAELANVLIRKFDWDDARAPEVCREIADVAVIVRPTRRIDVLRDKPDNRLLECAIAGHAERLVTGDKHLLRLGKYRDVSIVRLADFLREIA